MTKTKQIKKILIANRGEIACRVIKTARKMGISTVAVYSDADRKALHVRLADESVHIGPSPAVESYLVIEKIIAAAKETGADAVHPGYGFLSENPDFVRACEKAKLIFIGPSAEAMEAMGLKDAAKKLMDEAGVPITPGYHGKDQSPKLLKAKAGMIGYPVLIKAVAGGGGKGMRKVEVDADFDAALASCKREAASSFGNEDVLIEKYIQSPRHIEVQVFGDTHGNVVHMFERDCSLQRRHQKVIEEAPAPGMTDAVRKAMTDAAIAAAKAVNYVGAGTVEFIVDGSGKLRTDGFWFMEMNTRLQVEHPVTEMITGLDLVEWQIRVARGEALPKQGEIKMEGHAIEARIYAEDPANDFLPSIGTLKTFAPASDLDRFRPSKSSYKNNKVNSSNNIRYGLRTDTGVTEGDEISVYYDPMIAKFIAYEYKRFECIRTLAAQIIHSKIEGLKTNSAFLRRCLYHPNFAIFKPEEFYKATTNLIERNFSTLTQQGLENENKFIALAASALTFKLRKENPSQSVFSQTDNWRLNSEANLIWIFEKNELPIQAVVKSYSDILCIIELDDNEYKIADRDLEYGANSIMSMGFAQDTNDFSQWRSEITNETVHLSDGYFNLAIKRYAPWLSNSSSASSDTISAPMPGKIIALNVAAGDSVSEGEPLVVMEAMKMEQTLTAPRDGVVAEIGAEVGELVTDGALLVRLEEDAE